MNTESAMAIRFLPSSVMFSSIFSLVPDQVKNRVKHKDAPPPPHLTSVKPKDFQHADREQAESPFPGVLLPSLLLCSPRGVRSYSTPLPRDALDKSELAS